MMNADMLEAIELGKAKLAEQNRREMEEQMAAALAAQKQKVAEWMPWAGSLANELPGWMDEFIPGPPDGQIGHYQQTVTVQLPNLGEMRFDGMKTPSGKIQWGDIDVRLLDYGSWEKAERDFHLALGHLAQLNEYQEKRRAQWQREEEEDAKVAAAAFVPVIEMPAPAIDPFKQIAVVLERLTDAVEDIAAIVVAFEPLLKQLTDQVQIAGTVGVWGDEDDADPLAIPL